MTDKEPQIIINGYELSNSESMTVRAAIEGFSEDLKENGLGEDEHGIRMARLYLKNIEAIRIFIFE